MADAASLSDGELARWWATGDRGAFEEAYRRYAPALFGTAVGLLGDRSAAADVVHDVFVRAAPRVKDLRDQGRLRAWLFAILRNEAADVHRARRHDGGSLDDPSGGAVTGSLADDATPADVLASQSELAALVWSAADGLQGRDREVLELNLRGGLETADLADALGVTSGHAAVLLSRMRDRLERCLGALVLARAGRKDCDALDRLLEDWDGRFSFEIRSRVTRHIDGCPRCSSQRAAMVTMERLAPAILPPAVLVPVDLHSRLVASLSAAGQTGMPAAGLDSGRWRADGFPEQHPDPVQRAVPDGGQAAVGGAGAVLGAAAGEDTPMPPAAPAAGTPPVPYGGRSSGRRHLVVAGVLVAVALLVGGAAIVWGTRGGGSDGVEVALETPAGPASAGPLASLSASDGGTTATTGTSTTSSLGGTTSAASPGTKKPGRSGTKTTARGSSASTSSAGAASSTGTDSGTDSGTSSGTDTGSDASTTATSGPKISRAALSPSTVDSCGQEMVKVVVVATGSGALKVTATWTPDGKTEHTDQLSGSGSSYDGAIGPFTTAMKATVDIVVTDSDGRTATRSPTLVVEPCQIG